MEHYSCNNSHLIYNLITCNDHRTGSFLLSLQYWIALAGAPGSGKTTVGAGVVTALQQLGVPAVLLSMDGFHYYKQELDAMSDPAEVSNFTVYCAIATLECFFALHSSYVTR
jgi:Ni2+-binding GTPase involved in maturation of urease and hydrogenase